MISNLKFKWYTKQEILDMSEIEITVGKSLDKFGHPIPNGMYDLKMGPCESDQQCESCGLNQLQCPGHFGHINIQRVLNPLVFDVTYLLIRAMCNHCNKLKLTTIEKLNFYLELESCIFYNKPPTIENYIELENILLSEKRKEERDLSKHTAIINSWLKKSQLRIKYPLCNSITWKIKKGQYFQIMNDDPVDGLKLVSINNIYDELLNLYNNEKILLSKMYFIDDNVENGLAWLFIDILPVIPNKFRPAKKRNDFLYENPLNTLLSTILNFSTLSLTNDKYISELQYRVSLYFDNTNPSSCGIKQILEKKEGLFRNNIMGKRVNYSARSVISPDPCISTDEIGLPLVFANQLTFPEKINKMNIEHMRKLIINGADVYPGANFVKELDEDNINKIISLKHLSKSKRIDLSNLISSNLEKYVVYRHAINGDRVLVNRQPTLHIGSLMGHKIKVLKDEKTLRLHYVNCKPYNADFDGDEINIHLPQSYLAMAEIDQICKVENVFLIPSTGQPIRGLAQDHIIGAAMLSQELFNKEEYIHILHNALYSHIGTLITKITIFKKNIYSGKDIVSSILINLNLNINQVFTSKIPNLPPIVFENGIMKSGVLDKSTIGPTLNSLIHAVQAIYGCKMSDLLLTAFGRMVNVYLLLKGFTLGYDDLLLNDFGESLLEKELVHRDNGTSTLHTKDINMLLRETNETLSKLQQMLCNITYKTSFNNHMLSIILSGSKGNLVNLSQISICLGQQELEGKKVPVQISGKSLPTFTAMDYKLRLEAGGFVYNRFLTGLTPHSLYFHCMAGREGLVDTAIKTANSGYLQRCMAKHLEGVIKCYDDTIRNGQRIISFVSSDKYQYGDSVGILAAQSIGEPSTQMTLNTFHLAGVGSQNVTLGIPRLREIIMVASKSIKTPMIVMELPNTIDKTKIVDSFRIISIYDVINEIKVEESFVKSSVSDQYEKQIKLSLMCNDINDKLFQYIKAVLNKSLIKNIDKLLKHRNRQNDINDENISISVNRDNENYDSSTTENEDDSNTNNFTINSISDSELKNTCCDDSDGDENSYDANSNVKNDESYNNINCYTKTNRLVFILHYPSNFNHNILNLVETILQNLFVKEISDFKSYNMISIDNSKSKLILEGNNFTSLYSTKAICMNPEIFYHATSNDIYAIFLHLGIEACRITIINEIKAVFDIYGIIISEEHLELIADYMCHNGTYQPFNRYTFNMNDSIIQKMSFESCFKNIKEAVTFQLKDKISVPSANITVGNKIQNGTGLFELLYNIDI